MALSGMNKIMQNIVKTTALFFAAIVVCGCNGASFFKAQNHNTAYATDKDYIECANTIKKYPYTQLIESLKQGNDFFIAVITYNSSWGMFPNYIYLQNPKGFSANNASIIPLNKEMYSKVLPLVENHISFGNSTFIKGGQNSIPAIFHLVIVYNKDKTAEIILSKLSNETTKRYENGLYSDSPFLFLLNLANTTNTSEMFESIYGIPPTIY